MNGEILISEKLWIRLENIARIHNEKNNPKLSVHDIAHVLLYEALRSGLAQKVAQEMKG